MRRENKGEEKTDAPLFFCVVTAGWPRGPNHEANVFGQIVQPGECATVNHGGGAHAWGNHYCYRPALYEVVCGCCFFDFFPDR